MRVTKDALGMKTGFVVSYQKNGLYKVMYISTTTTLNIVES